MPTLRQAAVSMLERASPWQSLMDELVLFPQGERDDLFDGLQTMVEGATCYPTIRVERWSPIARL